MTRKIQDAEFDRLQALAPRDSGTAFGQTYTDNQQPAAANVAATMAARPPPGTFPPRFLWPLLSRFLPLQNPSTNLSDLVLRVMLSVV
jgi:hypothetical protein